MLSGNDQTDIILYLYIGIILSSLLTGKMLVFIFVFFNILTESNILFSVVSFFLKNNKNNNKQTNKQAMSVFFLLFCHPLVAEKTVILYVVFVGMLLSAIICIIVI